MNCILHRLLVTGLLVLHLSVLGASPAEETGAPAAVPTPIDNMLFYALTLIGAKYKYGGDSIDAGFDCSGYVRHVFATVSSMELPRTSYAMAKLGVAVTRAALQPGDLVFYNTRGPRHSHVGIYLGEGRFVHAPSSGKEVEIVDMAARYWRQRYNSARRLEIMVPN